MRRRFLSLALALALTLALVPTAFPASAAAFTPITGWEMMEKLGVGINIGNTLEARSWPEDDWSLDNHMHSEFVWGEARIEQWHFKAIAQKGFAGVRIPISWEPHMDDDYNIDEEWMERVREVVDWALAAGLIVTINTHHESGFYDLMHTGTYDQAKEWLMAVWTQVAERFKEYPETLIFEPMNEPRPGATGWHWDYDLFAKEIPILSETSNRLSHDALALIRNSGGYNDKRVVALTIQQADPNLLYLYEHPDDPYAMVGVFFYPSDRWEENALSQIKAALDKKIPVVIKEIAPIFEPSDEARLVEWGAYAYGELAKLGVPTQYWNHGGSFEIFNRHTGEWPRKPLLEAIFTAHGLTPGPDYVLPSPFPYELKGPFEDSAFTYWQSGSWHLPFPPRILEEAEKMVVEYEGTFTGGYAFVRHSPSPWAQFDNGDPRITEEPGKLTFDLRGLEGTQLGFAAWSEGDAAKIKRVHLDTWEGTGFAEPEPAPNLSDATGWAHTHINEAFNKGFLPTELQSNYTADITRGEFVRLAMSWLRYKTGLTNDELVAAYAKPEHIGRTFSDTDDPEVLAAARLDITAGVGGNRFGVDDPFQRQTAAVMAGKVYGILDIDISDAPDMGFSDINQAADWARNAINFVAGERVMNGSGGMFFPTDNYSREQSITVFNQMG